MRRKTSPNKESSSKNEAMMLSFYYILMFLWHLSWAMILWVGPPKNQASQKAYHIGKRPMIWVSNRLPYAPDYITQKVISEKTSSSDPASWSIAQPSPPLFVGRETFLHSPHCPQCAGTKTPSCGSTLSCHHQGNPPKSSHDGDLGQKKGSHLLSSCHTPPKNYINGTWKCGRVLLEKEIFTRTWKRWIFLGSGPCELLGGCNLCLTNDSDPKRKNIPENLTPTEAESLCKTSRQFFQHWHCVWTPPPNW